MKITLRISIILSFVLLVTLSNLGIISYFIYYNTKITEEKMDDLLPRISGRVIDITDEYFRPSIRNIRIIKKLAEYSIIKPDNPETVEKVFFLLMQSSPSTEMLNIGFSNGDFLMLKRMSDSSFSTKIIKSGKVTWKFRKPGSFKTVKTVSSRSDGYDPRKRSWYKGAMNAKGKIFWAKPYIFHSDQKPGITASVQIKTPQSTSVISVDIGLYSLSEFVRDIRFSEHGAIMIINGEHKVLATPNGPLISGKNLLSLSESDSTFNKLLHKSLRKMSSTKASFEYNGEKYLIGIRKLSFTDGRSWYAVVYFPEKDFTGKLDVLFRTASYFMLIALIFSILGSLLISYYISKPLNRLNEEVNILKKYEFSEKKINNSPFAEINNVLSSFENLKTGLRAFEKYVPSDLVKILLKKDTDPKLGGEYKELVMLFSDIQGFTTISEKLKPHQVTQYLGDYLEIMSRIIIESEGTVDKYIGDAVMAFWGAPLEVENKTVKACEAMLEAYEKTLEFNEKHPERPAFITRFGLHKGDVVVGNIGSPRRFNYTIVGDNVNLASRLEGINKIYFTNLIISETVYEDVKDVFECRKLDIVAVKGKKKPITIYEMLGRKNKIDRKLLKIKELHEQALELYINKDFIKAKELFERGVKEYGENSAFSVFVTRCEYYINNPPSDDWNGVTEIKTK